MSSDPNPYAAPRADLTPLTVPTNVVDAESIRQAHLKHEASVRSVGVLYYVNGLFFGLGTLGMIPVAFRFGEGIDPFFVSFAGFYLLIAAACFWVGRACRMLKPHARIPIGIFAALGLIYFPIGTLLGPYVLYLAFNRKGVVVFSKDYQEVIRQTPHIRYRTPAWLWVVLIVSITALIAAGVWLAQPVPP